jgi:hypothetical protein
MWSIRLNMMASQIPLREIPVIERRAHDTPRPHCLAHFSRLITRLR